MIVYIIFTRYCQKFSTSVQIPHPFRKRLAVTLGKWITDDNDTGKGWCGICPPGPPTTLVSTRRITDWVIRENKLVASHGGDFRNIRLHSGGAAIYFKLNASNRDITQALGIPSTTTS